MTVLDMFTIGVSAFVISFIASILLASIAFAFGWWASKEYRDKED